MEADKSGHPPYSPAAKRWLPPHAYLNGHLVLLSEILVKVFFVDKSGISRDNKQKYAIKILWWYREVADGLADGRLCGR